MLSEVIIVQNLILGSQMWPKFTQRNHIVSIYGNTKSLFNMY